MTSSLQCRLFTKDNVDRHEFYLLEPSFDSGIHSSIWRTSSGGLPTVGLHSFITDKPMPKATATHYSRWLSLKLWSFSSFVYLETKANISLIRQNCICVNVCSRPEPTCCFALRGARLTAHKHHVHSIAQVFRTHRNDNSRVTIGRMFSHYCRLSGELAKRSSYENLVKTTFQNQRQRVHR